MHDASPVSPVVGSSESASIGGSNLVLVLEDNESIALMLTMVLAKLNLRAICCETGAAALAAFAERPAEIRLVLSDCRLPDMDGRDACRIMREQLPSLPVLLMSGHVNSVPHAFDTPFVEFLPKPYSPAELLDRIRALLANTEAALGAGFV